MPFLSSHAPSAERRADLDPIRIVTDAIELVGFVAPTGQRVTDMLLRGQDLAFLPAGAEETPDAWISVAPADVLFVVPPPLPARPDWRSPADSDGAFVRVGPYRLIGTAHRRVTPTMGAQQAFLPLTSVSISRDGERETEDVEVAIVNLLRADEVRPSA